MTLRTWFRARRFLRSNWLAISIVVAHFALGVIYSVATPLWEAYDEWGHYPYVKYVATQRALPRRKLVEWNDETHQLPLYYIVGGLATCWIDTSDELEPVPNPYSVGKGGEGGMNLFLHLDVEDFPYRGTVLAIRTTRLVSVLLSTVVVWVTYLVARVIFPKQREIALGAMAVNAFWPQFLFIGSVVSNDIMVTVCSSLFLLFLVKIVAQGLRVSHLFGLAFSLGGALMSKANGLALLPPLLMGLTILTIKEVRRGRISVACLGSNVFFLLGLSLISFVWWSRGLWKEFHQRQFRAILSLVSHPSSIAQLHWDILPEAMRYCLATLWGRFGWGIISVEDWIYKLVFIICLAACLGLIISFSKRLDHSAKLGTWILALHALSALSIATYPVLLVGSAFWSPGRWVLPAISAISVLLFSGLVALVPRRFERAFSLSVGLVMFVYALLVPFRYILPVYAKPKLLSPVEIRDLEHPLGLHFGDRVELVGYELDDEEVVRGEEIPVTLYWRCLEEMEEDYALAVKILGQDYEVYGVLHLHPGRGNFPTSTWKKGNIFRETYRIPISCDVPTPSLAKIGVDFFIPDSPEESLPARDPEGKPRSAIFGKLAVRAKVQPEYRIENLVYYNLGDKVALIGYEIDEVMNPKGRGFRLTLYWQALAEMDRDYTVFVHLIDEEGEIRGQRDSQPLDTWYPTSLWKVGEVIEDKHSLFFSSLYEKEGEYQIAVGMYDLATMERLTAFDDRGTRLPNDQINLGEIRLPVSS